jgi:hypothetical protein
VHRVVVAVVVVAYFDCMFIFVVGIDGFAEVLVMP